MTNKNCDKTQIVICKWVMTHDTWRMTHDTWSMTHDTWHKTHGAWHITHDTWPSFQNNKNSGLIHDAWYMPDQWHSRISGLTHVPWPRCPTIRSRPRDSPSLHLVLADGHESPHDVVMPVAQHRDSTRHVLSWTVDSYSCPRLSTLEPVMSTLEPVH